MTTPSTGNDRDRLLDHDYDQIKEYDNPLPGWWVWLFVATIVFSVGYVGFYHMGPGQSVIAQYEEEMRVAAQQHPQQTADAAITDEALRALQSNQAAMSHAREIFTARCAPCHGPEGQGLIGPNLTDEYWLHGGRLTEILHTITEGVPDKGMVPWKGQLQPAELHAMAAFIGTLEGTHPSNAKPPQGTKVSRRGAPVAMLSR